MRKAVSAMVALALLACMAAGCADKGPAVRQDDTTAPASQSQQQLSPAEMETEQQLRDALALLPLTPETAAQRMAFYAELQARDLLTEQDHQALADLYGQQGDRAAQRSTLWQAFLLYPNAVYAQQLQQLVVLRTQADADVAALMEPLRQALSVHDPAALRELVKSEGWVAALQEAPQLYATRTLYTDEEWTAQVCSDAIETSVWMLASDGRCLYGRVNDAGAVLASGQYTDGNFNGGAAVAWFDEANTLYKNYEVTLAGGVCVGEAVIEYDGARYTATFDEAGHTTEKQLDAVTDAGGVIYAYQADGRSYLYQPETTVEAFCLDAQALGLPVVEVWS